VILQTIALMKIPVTGRKDKPIRLCVLLFFYTPRFPAVSTTLTLMPCIHIAPGGSANVQNGEAKLTWRCLALVDASALRLSAKIQGERVV